MNSKMRYFKRGSPMDTIIIIINMIMIKSTFIYQNCEFTVKYRQTKKTINLGVLMLVLKLYKENAFV